MTLNSTSIAKEKPEQCEQQVYCRTHSIAVHKYIQKTIQLFKKHLTDQLVLTMIHPKARNILEATLICSCTMLYPLTSNPDTLHDKTGLVVRQVSRIVPCHVKATLFPLSNRVTEGTPRCNIQRIVLTP
ncbi:hypothetical protein PoB_006796800 [Plakobranchus ocellatus]|uniref:Uncharacterized protein n=1 Tax=Plakobranchus ocellatus TaxID=259542 RepID=A0AAV4DB76_9GAST|nr:hypothetical protein PoB_006796800 [Plakobranchus ocellatus]